LGLEILHENQLLTQENLDALLLGDGAHARCFLNYHFVQQFNTVTQPLFEKIMRQPYKEALSAAILLGQHNRNLRNRSLQAEAVRLPADMIGHIASFLGPNYRRDKNGPFKHKKAVKVASSIESLGSVN